MRTILGFTSILVVAALFAATPAFAQKQSQAKPSQIDSTGIELVEKANAAAKQGRFQEALDLCERALAVEPENTNALYLRGLLLLQTGKPADAERSLARVIELEPDLAAPHAALGEAYLALARDADAERELTRALSLDSASAGARANLAIALWRTKDFAGADRELTRLETSKQATADSFVLHGQVLEALGKSSDAAAAYTKAIGLDAKSADAFVFRGRLRAKAGDMAGAVEDLSASNALRPDEAVAKEIVGLETRSGDAAGAIDALRQRLAANPKDVEARRALADELGRAGRVDEAKKEIDVLVAESPTDPKVFDFAGDVVLSAAPLDAARYYVKAVRLAPENVEYRLKLGSALVRADQSAAAVEHFKFAADKAPDRREAHSGLGAALYSVADYAGAAREFGWLAAREPDSATVQFFLGASLDRLGDCEGARSAFERFVAHADPDRDKSRVDEVTTFVLPRIKRQLQHGDCKRSDAGGKNRKGV